MSLFIAAATAMEEAARLAQTNKVDNPKRIVKYFTRAAEYFRANKQYEKACDALVKAAEFCDESGDTDGALKQLSDACEIEEDEERFKMVHDYFEKAIKLAVTNSKFKHALQFLQRQIVAYESDLDLYTKRIWTNITSICIIHYQLKDVRSAQRLVLDALEKYPGEHPERQFCQKLLFVFEKADEEGLQALQKTGDFGLYLTNNAVVRLGKKLTMQDISAMSVPEEEIQKVEQMKKQEEVVRKELPNYDEVIKTEVDDIKVDEEGAPDLLG